MVVQNQPKKNKIKYKYLINLTREKIEITNNIHYNMLRNVKKMFSAWSTTAEASLLLA